MRLFVHPFWSVSPVSCWCDVNPLSDHLYSSAKITNIKSWISKQFSNLRTLYSEIKMADIQILYTKKTCKIQIITQTLFLMRGFLVLQSINRSLHGVLSAACLVSSLWTVERTSKAHHAQLLIHLSKFAQLWLVCRKGEGQPGWPGLTLLGGG